MRSFLTQPRRKLKRPGVALILQIIPLAGSLLMTPMGLAADQHPHHGDVGEASGEKVIYREGGAMLHDRMMEEVKRQQEAIGQKGGYSTGANSHMLQQGVLLVAEDPSKIAVTAGQRCPANAPIKEYHVSAINIEITLSRFLDYFPGYMYVLKENVEKARGEEAANREAREKENDPGAVSNGLQGDVIQPLVIRANQGDCLKLTLHNEIPDDPTSLVINGSSMVVAATGKPATPSNPEGSVASGGQQSFEWYIKPDTQEGARFFRSHASREQFNQGLIGMLVVEPRGSRYLSPFDGKPMASGCEAMIEDPKGADFREFAIFYHEAGDEAFRLLNKKGEMLPQRDPHTDSYRPGARLLNYRSEPHGTRIELQAHMGFYGDESMAYGSYTFGDPATTIPRSYLGDPAKFRMAGGSEIVHSHHLHGGSIRWARQPGNSNLDFALSKNGPVKFPAISDPSDRLDVQSIGPTEVYDQVIEGGSGGLQALAGEFVFHCHIPQHYVTGMWGFWRVYNTLQASGSQTDVMKPLVELPDRVGKIKTGTPSDKLVGTTVDWYGGKKYEITKDKTDWKANPVKVSIKDWVEMMLTPQGKPGKKNTEKEQTLAYDSTVNDWAWDGQKAMSELETTYEWVNYKSATPGKRQEILFDPQSGKIAWPWLRPHLGRRVPFSPSHSGAPWLEPIHRRDDGSNSTEPPKPGEQGPWSLCPEGAPQKFFNIHAITLPITLKKATAKTPAIVDPGGLLYVLHEEEQEVRKNPARQMPLVIRGNVQDCIDVVYKSELKDDVRQGFSSKTNLHPHMFQFDTQASDGPIIGFSYEMSLRPFTILKDEHPGKGMPVPMNTTMEADAAKGASSIKVKDASRYHVKTELGVGMDEVGGFESARISKIEGNTITFERPLMHSHKKGEIVSVEWIRERWYVDADFGTTFWHDHVFGLDGWGHGFYSTFIAEPPRSTYHDPMTGKEVRSGPVADIHTLEPVSAHIRGSFREIVTQVMDSNPRTAELITADNPQVRVGAISVDGTPTAVYPAKLNLSPMKFLNGGEATTGGGYNMRVEPLSVRLANNPDPSQLFSSLIHGDPETPMLRAYLGDPIVVRLIEGSANEVHSWHISGHWFPMERYSKNSIPRSSLHVVIGERYDAAIPAAGGPQQMAGDYPYYSGRASHFVEGSWGLFRVLDKADATLRPLPGREEIPQSAKSVCPSDAPVKTFNVAAIDKAIRYNKGTPGVMEVDMERKMVLGNETGKMYVLEGEKTKVASGSIEPSPLTLHVNVGDCIKVNLKNEMAKDRAGFHVDHVAYDPKESMGINAGNNPGDQTVAPGQSRTYTFFAHPEFGENAALIQDWGNVIENPRNGLFGAIIIGPRGSQYRDSVTGEDLAQKSSWRADVIVDRNLPGNENRQNYRSFALLFQDEDNQIGTSFMPYIQKVAGVTAVNYRSEPTDYRIEKGCAYSEVLVCVKTGDQPVTPSIAAHVGDAVVIHVLGAFSEQIQLFSVSGHEWKHEPYMSGADLVSTMEFGGTEVINAWLHGGAGGPNGIPGSYLWLNQRPGYLDAGHWGTLTVLDRDSRAILPLSRQAPSTQQAEEQNPTQSVPVSMKGN